MYALNWNKCQGSKGSVWCPFLTVNLGHPSLQGVNGVYIIWHSGPTPWTVYVGQGNIAERLGQHRRERGILQYSPLGLFVTWASVPWHSTDGIERYLADVLKPKEGQIHPNVPAIEVNLPW